MGSSTLTLQVQESFMHVSTALERQNLFGDAEALALWLSVFLVRSKATARSYRSQISKFGLFLSLLHPEWNPNHRLQQAQEFDVMLYELALGLKSLPNGTELNLHLSHEMLQKNGLAAQPFAKSLKKSSIDQALSVLNAFYEYLRTPNGVMNQPYVSINPIKRVRKSKSRSVQQTDRHIPHMAIQAMNTYLLAAIESSSALSDQTAVMRYERKLWIFTLLFGLWGRREEICRLTMGDFKQRGTQEWEVLLKRKGGKEEYQPVANWVITGLHRYRRSLGLPELWTNGETLPAIARIRGRLNASIVQKHISSQMLYLEVTEIATQTASEIEHKSLLPDIGDEERMFLVNRLKLCSPHWFRHTGPTIAINNGSMSLQLASKILGHSSVATTSQMYFHADKQKMRAGLDALGESLVNAADVAA